MKRLMFFVVIVVMIPACTMGGAGMMGIEGERWLEPIESSRLHVALAETKPDEVHMILVKAFGSRGLDLNDDQFRPKLLKQVDLPAAAFYLTAITGLLSNSCNFSYALFETVRDMPPTKRQLLVAEWLDRTRAASSREDACFLAKLCFADALMRSAEFLKAEDLLEVLEPQIRASRLQAAPRLLSLLYVMAAETQLGQYYLQEDGKKDAAFLKAAKYLYQKAKELDLLADVHVSYALWKSSKNNNAPTIAVGSVKRALELDPGNIMALAVLRENNEFELYESQQKYVEGTFTMSAGWGITGPTFDIGWTSPTTDIGGISSLAKDVNVQSLSGTGIVASTRFYPAFTCITEVTKKGAEEK